MAQGDPPVYQLVDSNGNVQAEIRHDLAQSLIIDQLNGSDIDFQQSDLSNIASVSTEQIGSGRHYAGAFDGADPDARLDNVLSAASNGDTIYVENAEYDATRTVSKSVTFTGTAAAFGGADIRADWTVSADNVNFVHISLGSSTTLSLDGSNCKFIDGGVGGRASIIVGGNSSTVNDNTVFGSVTFESGTSDGIADGNSAGGSFTDSGTNIIGDNA